MSRILIVDDEPMIAELLVDWLGELGDEPLGPSRNTTSALALIEATPPDAAIIDLSLGAESGYPVAESPAKSKIEGGRFGAGRSHPKGKYCCPKRRKSDPRGDSPAAPNWRK